MIFERCKGFVIDSLNFLHNIFQWNNIFWRSPECILFSAICQIILFSQPWTIVWLRFNALNQQLTQFLKKTHFQEIWDWKGNSRVLIAFLPAKLIEFAVFSFNFPNRNSLAFIGGKNCFYCLKSVFLNFYWASVAFKQFLLKVFQSNVLGNLCIYRSIAVKNLSNRCLRRLSTSLICEWRSQRESVTAVHVWWRTLSRSKSNVWLFHWWIPIKLRFCLTICLIQNNISRLQSK